MLKASHSIFKTWTGITCDNPTGDAFTAFITERPLLTLSMAGSTNE